MTAPLPIDEILPQIRASLAEQPNLVLQAPPGAGKTTGVPPALLDAPWLAGRRILMLEPRRLATRAAARRIAQLLGDEVGGIAGYRVRMDSKVTARTRIEIVTDGIFTRMIQDDPSLERVGAVLFDEIHERRLDSDLGLALALETQSALRPDLRLVAMSATLDAGPIAALLDAPILTAEGRAFPVDLRHRPAPAAGIQPLAEAMADAIVDAMAAGPGDVLAFLPGGPEIRRTQRALEARRLPAGTEIHPLFGDLPQPLQDRALAPAAPGQRKIVLSTAIAETSLTIEGVRHVVDSGLSRVARYDPASGMTRLTTVKISQAGATQRAGRAGRTAPGTGWRLWPAAAHGALPEFAAPEIATADLTGLALELAAWGVADPAQIRLLDPPPAAAYSEARRLLTDLAALDGDGRITAHGRAMGRLGTHPRLAHMLLAATADGNGALAAALAALLGERDIGRAEDCDLRHRVTLLANHSNKQPLRGGGGGEEPLRRARETARRFAKQAGATWSEPDADEAGAVLALAYPDRVGKRRAARGRFQLSGGRGAFLPEHDPLAGEEFLVVADLDGQRPDARIHLAAPVSQAAIERVLAGRIRTEDRVELDPDTGSVQARRQTRLGALVLAERNLPKVDPELLAGALLQTVARRGLDMLPWTDAARSLQARVAMLGETDSAWPRIDDVSLLAAVDDWLAPALHGRRNFNGLDMGSLLHAMLPYELQRALDQRAPTHFTVPTGNRLPIEYRVHEDGSVIPTLRVRVQELFGLSQHPSLDRDRVKLLLELLSPAHRPIQVTRDLPGFWAGSWKQVRGELRGRYPRHSWPDDPAAAAPTARAKPRGT